MQSSNERLTTGPGSGAGALSELTESDRRARDSLASYREFAFIQPATARPMAGPESSWMKCEPGTVTSVWFFQLRQDSRGAPIKIAPGSALTNSLGMSHCA